VQLLIKESKDKSAWKRCSRLNRDVNQNLRARLSIKLTWMADVRPVILMLIKSPVRFYRDIPYVGSHIDGTGYGQGCWQEIIFTLLDKSRSCLYWEGWCMGCIYVCVFDVCVYFLCLRAHVCRCVSDTRIFVICVPVCVFGNNYLSGAVSEYVLHIPWQAAVLQHTHKHVYMYICIFIHTCVCVCVCVCVCA
jgi:hypothetical protein